MSTIWFACKKCGRKHHRPGSSAGTFIFCDCGEGNVVPWESSAAPEALPEPPPVVARPMPLEPLPVLTSEEGPAPYPLRDEPPALPERPRPGRRPLPRRRDPRFCFNHEDAPSAKPCDDCKEAFCAECVVTFQGATVCGPCKNFRARMLQTPPRLSNKALISVLLALFTLPAGFCLVPLNVGTGGIGQPAFLLALVLHAVALLLGLWALRDTETNPRLGGRSLAITGALAAGVGCLATVLLTFFAPIQVL